MVYAEEAQYKKQVKLSHDTGVVVVRFLSEADFLQNTLTKQFTTLAKPL